MPTPQTHAQQSGLNLHEDKRTKQPVRAVATANLSVSLPGASIDGVSLASGDRVLLTAQTTVSENGPYVWSGATTPLTRTGDASSASDFVFGFRVFVREGASHGATYWTYTQSAAVTIGSTALTFAQDAASQGNQSANTVFAGPTSGGATAPGFRALVSADLPTAPVLSGELTVPDLKVTGLTGAISGMRIVGATATGSPTSGTFAVGDVVLDLSGKWWLCTGAGSPGSWIQASGSMNNPMSANQDLIVGSTNGAPARLAIGANSQVLGISGGVVGWVNNPAGFTNPMTTIGDMITGGTSGTPTRLANGANGQVLTIIAGQPGWANPTGGGGGSGSGIGDALFLSRNCI